MLIIFVKTAIFYVKQDNAQFLKMLQSVYNTNVQLIYL